MRKFAEQRNRNYYVRNYKTQKGIWFSYLEYSSLLMNKTASEFRTNIGKCFDNVKMLDFNTVYVQVRAFKKIGTKTYYGPWGAKKTV